MIYGDQQLQHAFDNVRQQILSIPRERNELAKAVVEMRHKMRDHLGKKKAGMFGLKQDKGGITDIEFLAQFLVLANAAEQPDVTRWSDNIRIFSSMTQEGIISAEDAKLLQHAYCEMRNETHKLNLLGSDAYVSDKQFVELRKNVKAIWQQILEPI